MEPRGSGHVVLVGAMGAGKTTIGRRLAASLGRPFIDNDEQLVRATGRSAAQIESGDGIGELHWDEAQLLRRALDTLEPAVIAAAASSIEDAGARAALGRSACVVWLRADATALTQRMPRSTTRPLSDADPAALVSGQAAARGPLFAGVADLVIDTTADDVGATIERILDAIRRSDTGD